MTGEGWKQCECEYCSLEGKPECGFAQLVKEREERISSLLVALDKSPSMYNDQGDVEMLRSFVQKYNKWVQEVRNPVYENGGEDWHKVSQALLDLSALRKIAKNLKAFEDINLHDGEKVTITIKRLDGTTQNLDGDWLVRVAELEEEKGEAN